LTSGNVTTALGFTPYNSTNPSGYQTVSGSVNTANSATTATTATTATYVTGLTSGNVTTALGFTPYNSTNPSGYQTTSGYVSTVSAASQGNITSVGTLTSLTMSGLITGASSASTDVNTANDTGSFSARGNTSTVASMSFHRTGAYAINMGLGTDNIFRIGGWSATNNCLQLSGSGALTILGSMTLNSNNGVTALVNGGTAGVGNIGASGAGFNTVFAKATSAQYADLAEKYLADQEYEIGTVLAVGGAAEVTACSIGDRAIGAVSENPAFKMNDGLENGTYVALKGRVPVKVIGSVRKGQRLVAANDGCAVAGVAHANDVFAVALESSDNVGVKLIESIIL